MPIKIKAQVLLITTFVIIFTAGIVYIMLLPTLSNLRSLNETTDSYQAIANAESGLEIELLNQVVSSTLMGSNLLNCTTTGHRSNNNEEEQERECKHNIGSRGGDKNEIHTEIKFNRSTGKLRVDSEGKKNKFSRTLFFETNINIQQPPTP